MTPNHPSSLIEADLSKQEKDILLEFECNCLTQLSRKRAIVQKKTFEDVSIHMKEEYDSFYYHLVHRQIFAVLAIWLVINYSIEA